MKQEYDEEEEFATDEWEYLNTQEVDDLELDSCPGLFLAKLLASLIHMRVTVSGYVPESLPLIPTLQKLADDLIQSPEIPNLPFFVASVPLGLTICD